MSLNLTVDHFRPQITSMTNTHTWDSILAWLAERDVIISRATLGRRLKLWEACSNTRIPHQIESPAYQQLVNRVDDIFHHQHTLSDTQIAYKLRAEEGLQTTRRQVKEIRLQYG